MQLVLSSLLQYNVLLKLLFASIVQDPPVLSTKVEYQRKNWNLFPSLVTIPFMYHSKDTTMQQFALALFLEAVIGMKKCMTVLQKQGNAIRNFYLITC